MSSLSQLLRTHLNFYAKLQRRDMRIRRIDAKRDGTVGSDEALAEFTQLEKRNAVRDRSVNVNDKGLVI